MNRRLATPVIRPRASGFTLVELVGIIVIVGVLAVTVLPRVAGLGQFQGAAFREQTAAALRHAQKTAVSHRRLVCATVNANAVTLTIAATNPAAGCGAAVLAGPDGNAAFASSSANQITSGTGVIRFQPSGLVTNNAGVVSDFSLTFANARAISITGATGHVE